MKELKFEAEGKMSLVDLLAKIPEGIKVEVKRLKRKPDHVIKMDEDIPLVFIQTKLWEKSSTIHPPLKYDKQRMAKWLKNVAVFIMVVLYMMSM